MTAAVLNHFNTDCDCPRGPSSHPHAVHATACASKRSEPIPPQPPPQEMKMSDTTNKPAWVEALDEAKTALRAAATGATPEDTDSKTRVAYGWLDIARILKD